jgi:hypothetical protein
MKHIHMSWHKQKETPGQRGKKNAIYFLGDHVGISAKRFSATQLLIPAHTPVTKPK